MPRNIEIKARVPDMMALRARVAAIADGPAEALVQHDVFFAAASGRLKLRIFAGGKGELIYYERANTTGPKTSNYVLVPTVEPEQLRAVLNKLFGEAGEVRKRREVYLTGRTRVHLDDVEGLGNFVELEVVLREGEQESAGETEARELMQALGVRESDLAEGAYLDLLQKRAIGC